MNLLPERLRGVAPLTGQATGRVTTFELFFDLVYVFAFTQVSRLMAEMHSGLGIVQALIVLALLWWTWVGFTWIANTASADQSLLRIVMTLAMVAVFIGALTTIEAYDDLEGGLYGPLVFAGAYTTVRVIHISLYWIVAADVPGLRRQLLLFLIALVPSVGLIIAGALAGGELQIWLWGIAILYDLAATRVGTSFGGGWRIPSVEHWAERHGLVVILALGESIVAIGVGVAEKPIDLPIIAGAAASVGLSVLLWWSYFARLSTLGEHALDRADDRSRVVLASDAYSYILFVVIAGIILTALGIEDAMKHVADTEPLGWFGAAALGAGLATFAAGTVLFALRIGDRRPLAGLVRVAILVAAIPLFAAVAPLVALTLAVAVLAVMSLIDGSRHHRARAESEHPEAVTATP